jgi:formylglycine-generating enzyme required for sulfatase activity
LPTAAEWQFAARAGTTGARYGDLNEIAWYNSNSNNTTHEVGQKKPNAFGLFDMLGNVFQWTADWQTTYTLSTLTDPSGAEIGQEKSLGGGSFMGNANQLRVSFRDRFAPNQQGQGVGFRCVGE